MPRAGNTTARGYGYAHREIRREWEPIVNAGQAICHARRCLYPTRTIPPHTPWDLGHNQDRTAWTGPEHRRCNRSEGATRGNHHRGHRQPHQRPWNSRTW